MIKETNHHNRAHALWQSGGVSSLTTPDFAQAPFWGRKGRVWPSSFSLSAPGLGELGRGWRLGIKLWAGTSNELFLCQEFCAIPFVHIPVPPHTSSTPRAEASSGSVWNEEGKVSAVQEFVLSLRDTAVQETPKGRADPREAGIPIPKAGCPWCCWFVPSLHLSEPSSSHNFSPWGTGSLKLLPSSKSGQSQDIPFLTHRAAKPQTPHFTLFIALVKRNTLRD